ncbi:MAG: hypothetical protein V4670_00835 [Bacteroidota bacterium]
MFIKYIKELSLKKRLKNSIKNVNDNKLSTSVHTIGLLIDENYFFEKQKLVEELIKNGIKSKNISLLAFRNNIKKNEIFDVPTFSNKEITWNGDFSEEFVNNFINKKFDMLISYYDVEKAPLLLITNKSKALFKAGFSSVDKRLNHLMVNSNAENYKVFVHELFRYLRILNKIK